MCDEREPLLAYLYDEIDAAERQRVEAHLATCERCREELDGLRSVRQDLLAWDVPEHESVWKPFSPARQTWSWRDVPAWSLAAAALVMLSFGVAGGLGASALTARRAPAAAPSPVATVAVPVAAPAPVAPAVTPADLAALEQRLMAGIAKRPQVAQTGVTLADYDKLLQINIDYQRALKNMTTRMDGLSARVDALTAAMAGAAGTAQNAQPGGR